MAVCDSEMTHYLLANAISLSGSRTPCVYAAINALA